MLPRPRVKGSGDYQGVDELTANVYLESRAKGSGPNRNIAQPNIAVKRGRVATAGHLSHHLAFGQQRRVSPRQRTIYGAITGQPSVRRSTASEPIGATTDDAALFELLCQLRCRMPVRGAGSGSEEVAR